MSGPTSAANRDVVSNLEYVHNKMQMLLNSCASILGFLNDNSATCEATTKRELRR
jgi:hypothetical protein